MVVEIIWQRPIFDRMDEIIRANLGRVKEISAALRRLNLLITMNPKGAGESRQPPYRIITVNPVTLYFRSTPSGKVVYIVGVEFNQRQRPTTEPES